MNRGFAYITFYEHEHAQKAIDTFNGHGLDNLIMQVSWAKNANTLETAIEKSAAWADACKEKDAMAKRASKAQVAPQKSEVDVHPKVSETFRFEGKIKGRDDGNRGNKMTRGFIQVSPLILQRHPHWQDSFKPDVFWHRNDCSNRDTRFPGDVVTFTLIVAPSGDCMQAQDIQLKR